MFNQDKSDLLKLKRNALRYQDYIVRLMDPQHSTEAIADIYSRLGRARNTSADPPCTSHNATPLKSPNNSQADSLSRGLLGMYTVQMLANNR